MQNNETGSTAQSRFLASLGTFAQEHKARYWEGSFAAFLNEIVPAAPAAFARNSHQYIWDMLGWSRDRESGSGADTSLFGQELFGVDLALERVADYFKAASAGSEVGRRLLLLLGPPSGGKSTLVILMKRGLEEYSHTDAGALYGI